MTGKRFYPLMIILLVVTPLVASCGSRSGQEKEHSYQLAPLEQMPAEVQQAPATVREAYQFAAHNADVLSEIPCYCGCGSMGHVSNYNCYFKETDQVDSLTYDSHALGCSICVDITQDAMRLLDQGQSVAQIYAYVDATYSRFGPPTPLK